MNLKYLLPLALLGLVGCAALQGVAPQATEGIRLFVPADTAHGWLIQLPPTVPERDEALWLTYLMNRTDYLSEQEGTPPNPGILTPAFEEEVYARIQTVRAYRGLQAEDPDLGLAYFDDLSMVVEAGFTREYCWLYLRQSEWAEPDDLELDAFDEWRDENLPGHRGQTYGSITLTAQQ